MALHEVEDKDGYITLEETRDKNLVRMNFLEVTINRYFPILSLTYIGSVLGLALKRGGMERFLVYFLQDNRIYTLSLIIAAWVSIPALIWIIMRCVGTLGAYANNWYKSTTFLMVTILLFSFLLFPPDGQGHHVWYTIRLFVAAAIPIHIVQYWFFIHGGLPTSWSATLGAIALSLALYGLLII